VWSRFKPERVEVTPKRVSCNLIHEKWQKGTCSEKQHMKEDTISKEATPRRQVVFRDI
jgi:hypothetical protein